MQFIIPGVLLLVVFATVLAFVGYALWPRPQGAITGSTHDGTSPHNLGR